MNTNAHARILASYIHRLGSRHLTALADLAQESEHAYMNLGLSSQLAAHNDINNAVLAAIEAMCEHDKQVIAEIIADER